LKSLVHLHGGEMSIQSQLDEGTTVTVALPLSLETPDDATGSNITPLTPSLRTSPQEQAFQVKKRA
jgi:cell cycle sensor histidine kinase DivJ